MGLQRDSDGKDVGEHESIALDYLFGEDFDGA